MGFSPQYFWVRYVAMIMVIYDCSPKLKINGFNDN